MKKIARLLLDSNKEHETLIWSWLKRTKRLENFSVFLLDCLRPKWHELTTRINTIIQTESIENSDSKFWPVCSKQLDTRTKMRWNTINPISWDFFSFFVSNFLEPIPTKKHQNLTKNSREKLKRNNNLRFRQITQETNIMNNKKLDWTHEETLMVLLDNHGWNFFLYNQKIAN